MILSNEADPMEIATFMPMPPSHIYLGLNYIVHQSIIYSLSFYSTSLKHIILSQSTFIAFT